MVTIFFPATSSIAVRHEKILRPFISTEHAPHRPSPQPYFAPVSANSSRSTSSRVRDGSVATVRSCPLRVNLIASMKYLSATNSLWPNHDFADTRPGLGGVRKYYPDFARARPLKFDFIKPSPDGPRRRLDLPGRVAPFFSIPDLHVVILRRFYAATIVVNRQLDASHFFLLP